MYTTAFPDLSLEVRSQYAPSDDVSISELTARGTHEQALQGIPSSGKKVEVVVCNVTEAHDGRIYRNREDFDTLTLMR
jgi:predicted ester cyclase